MKKEVSSANIAGLIWFYTSCILGLLWILFSLLLGNGAESLFGIIICIISLILSFPILLLLFAYIPYLQRKSLIVKQKISYLYAVCCLCILPYCLAIYIISGKLIGTNFNEFTTSTIGFATLLFSSFFITMFIINSKINNYFSQTKNYHFMEQKEFQTIENQLKNTAQHTTNSANKTLIKGLITGALILLMLIPTVFVTNLVTEREKLQQDVVKEVSNGWATEQTVFGPYLQIPYQVKEKTVDNKEIITTKNLFLLPENLNVDGTMLPEIRLRSIYKVLLYRSEVKTSGNFKIQLPKDIDATSLQLNEAKICYGISDYKGIEEKLNINFNGTKYDFVTGVPSKEMQTFTTNNTNAAEETRSETTTKQVESIGLSANVNVTIDDLQKSINFNMNLKLKGSKQLHFLPLSANSNFAISSPWPDPKFDGNNLPNTRDVSSKGFQAKWNFNNANLPFGTAIKSFNFNKYNFAFGVSMLQPNDQYSKTIRSVKYAILFIGLTFALFFIVELMQKKPIHPVQYVLIGIALVIFFTLLLSISEFILFDYAYLIASVSTIFLITLYAKSHFKSFKTASVFASLLATLYGFIFVLIRLEDAALLVGSIGLFIILALVMFGSRKINWYGSEG